MNKRQNEILEYITEHKKVEVATLSELYGVSQVTIRKDLNYLEAQGMITRNHGYASINEEDDINTRLAYHYEKKRRIALKAIEDIHDGDTIMIESGSCCALVAKEIATHFKDITIITNSAFISEYVRKDNVNIILLGGQYQKESQVMVGPLTRTCVSQFFVDKLFIGADGFTTHTGFTGKDYLRCETVKDMANQANEVIIVSESEKFGKQGIVNLLPTSSVSTIITDNELSDEFITYFSENQINIKMS